MAGYVPYIHTPPPGWSVDEMGQPIPPEGVQVDEMGNVIEGGPQMTGFPVLSVLGGAVAGKMIGKSTTALVAGGIIGFWLRPLE